VEGDATPATSAPAPPSPKASPVQVGKARWIIEENRKPGTRAWMITHRSPDTSIEGFADRVSAAPGDAVTLHVSTTATSYHVEAYRLGYYQGLGGRLIWTSDQLDGSVQVAPVRDPVTNMVSAPWKPSPSFTIGPDWPPGEYALKLVAADGGQGYVPLTIRDDSSHAALVIQSSVTTWEAYNDWGGYSLYHGSSGGGTDRAVVVSFDRPYAFGNGAGDLLDGNELTITDLVEKLGLDVTYWTDVDFHQRADLLLNHRALVTLGHDEYWSLAMRNGAIRARDAGVNLAFLGANADFRHIRLAPSPLGPNREEINYRSSSDPSSATDSEDVTTQWRNAPDPRPESELNGAMYECNPVSADMVITDGSAWMLAHTHLGTGSILPGLVGSEYDRVQAGYPTPQTIQIVAHSPVVCGGVPSHADMTYYTARSGAGVFDTGTSVWTTAIGWPCVLTGRCSAEQQAVARITVNVLRTFAAGPSDLAHPARPNLSDFGINLLDPIDP